MGIYRGLWGSMGSSDIVVFIKASSLATLLSVAAVTFIYRFIDFSKGIFIMAFNVIAFSEQTPLMFILGFKGKNTDLVSI